MLAGYLDRDNTIIDDRQTYPYNAPGTMRKKALVVMPDLDGEDLLNALIKLGYDLCSDEMMRRMKLITACNTHGISVVYDLLCRCVSSPALQPRAGSMKMWKRDLKYLTNKIQYARNLKLASIA